VNGVVGVKSFEMPEAKTNKKLISDKQKKEGRNYKNQFFHAGLLG
jgi:hypothetical protein